MAATVTAVPLPDESLRRNFRGYVRRSRQKQKMRLAKRVALAGAAGGGAFLAARYGGAKAARLLKNVSAVPEAGARKAGTPILQDQVRELLKKHLPTLSKLAPRRLRAKFPTKAALQDAQTQLALSAGGIAASRGGMAAVAAAERHAKKFGAGVAGGTLAIGTVKDLRRSRRKENRYARKLLTYGA